ncbi:MAG: endonuclease/exonuclease/phosphatase family protein [Opitutaceae bacterium]|nr:endonuclease/exonuclease/phosphatase family protein [Opitutaceae bacterium]
MKLRLATYNLNNLFQRPKLLQLPGFSDTARPVLKDIDELSELLARDSYAGATGARIVELLTKYGFASGKGNPWFDVNQAKAKLFSASKGKLTLKAAGRGFWLGWIELKTEDVDDEATRNTGRVIVAVKPDVLAVVEAESRPALERFNTQVLKPQAAAFPHTLLVDGNDPRGIDVGLYSRFPLRSVRPHIDDTYTGANKKPYPIFSRDCPEYEIELPGGRTLWLLVNHFKSQGYGAPASNDAKRLKQAQRVRAILGRFDLKKDLVAVAGDFNAKPEHASIAPLLATPHLRDVCDAPAFGAAPRWTYHSGKQQLDYLLVSAPLFAAIKAVGIERRGMIVKGVTPFPEVTKEANAASDHAAVWAEVDI